MQEMNDFRRILETYNDEDIVCICTIPAPDGKRKQRFISIRDLKTEKWLKFLKYCNANNSNIYMSVYSFKDQNRKESSVVDYVDRIFLDFDDLDSYKKFRNDYQGTVVINTSKNKYQVFLMLSKRIEKQRAKLISKNLAYNYNSDKTFDLSRVFRLPGFRNCKYSDRPLAKILEFTDVVYDPDSFALDSTLVTVEQKSGEIERVVKKLNLKREFTNNCDYDYKSFLERAPLKANGVDKDYSVADYRYALYLLRKNLSKEVVRLKLLDNSPNIIKRKGGGLENYLDKTIDNAMSYIKSNLNIK